MSDTQAPSIVFMGTPEFAVPCLRALIDAGYRVVAAVTQPDRPVGRKRVLTPTPVKVEALKHGIPVLQPPKLRAPEAVAELAGYRPDLIVTAAYGQLLPKAVLDMPRYGCVNVHGSLLPKYRGGAPIQRSIMNGDTVTGVTIMYMAEGLDTGDMISKVEVPIEPEDDSGSMYTKLSAAGAGLLVPTVAAILNGTAGRTPQNDAESTYAPNLTREDERIDWRRSAAEIHNQVRGLSPRPGAFTYWSGDVFKVWRTALPSRVSPLAGEQPGTVIALEPDGIHVATGSGALILKEVQPAGKKAMPASEFLKSGQMKIGDRLGREDT
jgi:methionyl-tRNA formyltransferase